MDIAVSNLTPNCVPLLILLWFLSFFSSSESENNSRIRPPNGPSPFHACARPPPAWPAAIRQSRHSFPKVEKWDEKHYFLALGEIHKYIMIVVQAVCVCARRTSSRWVTLPHSLFSYGEAPRKAVEQWAVKIHYIQWIFTQPAHQLNPIVSRRRCADRIFTLHREPYGWKWKVFHFVSAETYKDLFFFPLLVNLFIAQESVSIY